MENQKNNQSILADKINFNGFGISPEKVESLYASLNKGEEKSLPNERTIGEDKYLFMLKFRKGDNGIVYLNGFTAINKENENIQQYFPIGKDKLNFTSKEAYNLMEGRAVFKEIKKDENTKNPAWLKLDFNQKNENGNFKYKTYNKSYGFFPEKYLAKMGVDLNYKKDVLKSLKKGNIVKGTIEHKDEVKTVSFFANPEQKKVNLSFILSPDTKKEITMASNINNFTLSYLISNPKKQEGFISDLSQKEVVVLNKLTNERLNDFSVDDNSWNTNQLNNIAAFCSAAIEKGKSASKSTGQEK